MTDKELKPGCQRSHPHENMSRECELLTEIARLRNELANTRPAAVLSKTAYLAAREDE